MMRKLFGWLFGSGPDDDNERARRMRGIVVRSDGSAYRTAESVNEMVREYLAARSPDQGNEK